MFFVKKVNLKLQKSKTMICKANNNVLQIQRIFTRKTKDETSDINYIIKNSFNFFIIVCNST